MNDNRFKVNRVNKYGWFCYRVTDTLFNRSILCDYDEIESTKNELMNE